MSDKTKPMFSDSELAKCAPLGKQLESAGHELGRFLELCKIHGGLVTQPQAGIVLGVSRARVRQLIDMGQLTGVECFGKVFCSVREVDKRLTERFDDMAAERGENPSGLSALYRTAKADGRKSARA